MYGSEALVGFALGAARKPRGRQAASGDGELDVLDRRPKRSEKDTFVILAVFLLPFRARSLRETALEARITQHDKDRDRVGEVGFLHGGGTPCAVDDPRRFAPRNKPYPPLRVCVVVHPHVPALLLCAS